MHGGCRRQKFNQLTTDEQGAHVGDVEPQQLLIDEASARTESLTILHQQRATQGA
jgi:hypothetical protein